MAHRDHKRSADRRGGSRGAEPRPQDRPAAPGREQPVAQSVIAEAAYYRWQRDRGDAESNWLVAEQECRARAALLGNDGSVVPKK
jgi:hypothetical protein